MSVRDFLAIALPGALGDDEQNCACEPTHADGELLVDAGDCPGGGALGSAPSCRATAARALRGIDVDAVIVRTDALERRYDGRSVALFAAAGRFAARLDGEKFAATARRDPLAAAHAATVRGDRFERAAAESGLLDAATGFTYSDVRPRVGPTVAHARFAASRPDATLDDERELPTGAAVRIHAEPGRELRRYHLSPLEADFDPEAYATLAAARKRLAAMSRDADAPAERAVRAAASTDEDVESLVAVLEKHTTGYGVLTDFFADDRVSDVFATAPVGERPLRVRVDGETMRTNVTLPSEGAAALASRLRRASGRAFSRADPTIDATIEGFAGAERVRAAGVTDPVSDGAGFAFRAHGRAAFTLPALVANGTLTADAAAILSLAVERDAAGLVAGPRGAGKTTLLASLLWELPAATRLVAIEDTPELPLTALRERGRDAQGLRTDADGLSPASAVRTALRLGDGALVVGEIRGEEAPALYEAMRVGARGDTVLGTVHGADGEAVRERVVTDLGVEPAAFGATDFVVSLVPPEGSDYAVGRIEEVLGGADPRFEALYDRTDALTPTGRLDRGDSRLLASLAAPDETYGDVRRVLADRRRFLTRLADADRTAPEAVVAAHADRRSGGR